jgi:branched-chain amino acid transport system permease protein
MSEKKAPGQRLLPRWAVTSVWHALRRNPAQVIAAVILLIMMAAAVRNLIPQGSLPAAYQADQFLRQLLLGLMQGSIYAMLALGYSMMFGVVRAINFAHGEVFMAGAYGGFFALLAAERNGLLIADPGLALAIALASGTGSAILVALLVERVAFRPFRSASPMTTLIASLGASIALQQVFAALFGMASRRVPDVTWYAFSGLFPDQGCRAVDNSTVCRGIDLVGGRYDTLFLGVELRLLPIHGVVAVVGLLLVALLRMYIQHSKMGRAMRAAAEDRVTASLMGVDVNRTMVVSFALGAVLAGSGGVLYALYNHQIAPQMGFIPGIKALTAAVLGGLGNLSGAVLGGYFVGVVDAIAPSMLGLSSQYRDAITYVILILALVFRPQGMLGSSSTEQASV